MNFATVRALGWLLLSVLVLAACVSTERTPTPSQIPNTPVDSPSPPITAVKSIETTGAPPPTLHEPTDMSRMPTTAPSPGETAEVTRVTVSGEPGNYTFSVEISSPDEGCHQYADWWEVLTPAGELVYRRILLHSHVNEQPFTRSGGPVTIDADQEVLVRAHMNSAGYGETAMLGSPVADFTVTQIDPAEYRALENQPPLPDGCDF